MVQLSLKLLSSRKKQLWIDSLRIYCKAGSGGNGTPNYGGLGGPGGSVTIKVASEEKVRKKKKSEPTNLTELFKHTFKSDPLKQRVEASHGKHSSKNRLNGEKGEDKELIVSKLKALQFKYLLTYFLVKRKTVIAVYIFFMTQNKTFKFLNFSIQFSTYSKYREVASRSTSRLHSFTTKKFKICILAHLSQ